MNEPLPAVRFVPAQHREKAIIKIEFDYDASLIQRVKALPGIAWSQTMKCWYVPDTEPYRARFKMEMKTASVQVLHRISDKNAAAL